MIESIIVAIITGGMSIIGVTITVIAENRKTTSKMEVSQAVTDTKIEELTREVRMHNNFAIRIPLVEERLEMVNMRLDRLEKETAIKEN